MKNITTSMNNSINLFPFKKMSSVDINEPKPANKKIHQVLQKLLIPWKSKQISNNDIRLKINSRLNNYTNKNNATESLINSLQSKALKEHSKEFEKNIIKVTDDVYVGIGYGLANVMIVETSIGQVLIDSLENLKAMQTLLNDYYVNILGQNGVKRVVALIYSHFHTDHVSGSSAAVNSDGTTQVWAHQLTDELIKNLSTVIPDTIYKRSMKQFGSLIHDDEHYLNAGIGKKLFYSIREANTTTVVVEPTHIWSGSSKTIKFGNTIFELRLASGETKDQTIVWLPQKDLLFGADNIYKAFPNIYAIRGTETRDALKWAKSLDLMRFYNASFLVLGHTKPLSGKKLIWDTLTNYRDAIQYVHDQTVRYMNKGYAVDDIVNLVQLPDELKNHPYLQPFYGTVPWAVKSIYHHYLGWFSGVPQDLEAFSTVEKAKLMSDLVGDRNALILKAISALEKNQIKWALELISYANVLDPNCELTKKVYVLILKLFAANQSSASSRNWLLTSARQIEDGTQKKSVLSSIFSNLPKIISNSKEFYMSNETNINMLMLISKEQRKQCIENLKSVLESFQFLSTRLKSEKAQKMDTALFFNFTDTKEFICIHVRHGIVYESAKCEKGPDLYVMTTDYAWRKLLLFEMNPVLAVLTGRLRVTGMNVLSYIKLYRVLKLFEYTPQIV